MAQPLRCRGCDKVAPGETQVAYLYLHSTERPYEPEPWYGLKPCPFCEQPGLVLHPACDEFTCVACGEQVDRAGYRRYRVEANEKRDQAAMRARERAWRNALGDMAEPPEAAGGERVPEAAAAHALDNAANLLARAGLRPRGPR